MAGSAGVSGQRPPPHVLFWMGRRKYTKPIPRVHPALGQMMRVFALYDLKVGMLMVVFPPKYRKGPVPHTGGTGPSGTLERTRTSGLPLRRRSRYPLRYQGISALVSEDCCGGVSSRQGTASILPQTGPAVNAQAAWGPSSRGNRPTPLYRPAGLRYNNKKEDIPGKTGKGRFSNVWWRAFWWWPDKWPPYFC